MKRKAPGDGDANDTSSVVDLFGLAENRRVLLVGEGNLSFAASISKLTNKFILIASTYETEEQHCERFQGSQARTEELRKAGVQVLFGVDATDLASTLPQEVRERPFDRIIFQFPQHKERNKIHLNRELLCTFLREAKALLAPAGEVVVSLVQGQGGTPAEPGPARRPKDTWQAQEMGLEAGLLLTRVVPCPHLELEQLGYESTGFRGQGLRGSTKEVYQDTWQSTQEIPGICREPVKHGEGDVLSHDMSLPCHDLLASWRALKVAIHKLTGAFGQKVLASRSC